MSLTHAILCVRKCEDHSSKYPQFLQELLFKPLLRWVTDALYAAGARSLCLVRDDNELDTLITASCQPGFDDITLLTYGMDGFRSDLQNYVKDQHGECVIFTSPTLVTSHALVTLCASHVAGHKVLTELLSDDEIPTGVFCFDRNSADLVFSHMDSTMDLPQTCRRMHADGLPVAEFFVTDGRGGAARAATPMELHMVRRALQTASNEKHMRAGVTILDPASTFIGSDVVIGADTTILPGVMLEGETIIGEDCIIGPYTTIESSVIGNECVLQHAQIRESQIGSMVTLGPFVNVRPGCVISSGVRIGDFVELKNSLIGEGSKVPHLTYVGDTDVGSHVNVGCGCVTVNYDGHKKSRCVVEDGAFLGCNTNLVAPVKVGRGAYTAAGSTITQDIPPGDLAIARAHQVNKHGWAEEHFPHKHH